MNTTPDTKVPESIVPGIAIIVLLIVSLLGPIAMTVGSTIGLAICIYLFREQLRGRGWLTAAVSGVLAAALAAVVAVSLT